MQIVWISRAILFVQVNTVEGYVDIKKRREKKIFSFDCMDVVCTDEFALQTHFQPSFFFNIAAHPQSVSTVWKNYSRGRTIRNIERALKIGADFYFIYVHIDWYRRITSIDGKTWILKLLHALLSLYFSSKYTIVQKSDDKNCKNTTFYIVALASVAIKKKLRFIEIIIISSIQIWPESDHILHLNPT